MRPHRPFPTADERFNRILHVAPTCSPIRAPWRHLANTIELALSSVHASPKPKQQIDWFNHFGAIVCKRVRPMLPDRCLYICLYVRLCCNIDVLWPNG